MAQYKIKTIEELERYYYGYDKSSIRKAQTGGLTTTTDGTVNYIYGAYAWIQVNQEANGFGILPKNPWDRSGWRMVEDKADWTAASDRNGATQYGGTAEGGRIAQPARPDFNQVDIKPKIMQLPFQTSTVAEWLSTNSGDDFYGNGLESMRMIMAIRHKELLNQAILRDVETEAADASSAYDGSNDWETMDRIVSSDAEEDAVGGSQNNYYDPWDMIDRDTGTTYDCTVSSASGTLGTDGNLTDDVIRGWRIDQMERSGKDSTVYLGGYDVYNEIQGIYTSQVRYDVLGQSNVQIDVNGIQSFKGTGVGIHVASVYGIPFIPTKDAPHGTGDEVGRLFGFDTSDNEGFGYPRIGIQIALPTSYAEIGRGAGGWPFTTTSGSFVEDALYWTMGETICRQFRAQAKLRDIKV